MPDLAGISHIDLTVTDIDRSLAFYREVVGFAEVVREEGDEHAMVVMGHSGLNNVVCLNRHGGGDGSPFDEHRTGLDHLSFRVGSRAELEQWQHHLDDHGVRYTPIVDAPYGAVLVFRDPDNIQLELMAEPGS